MNVTLRRQQLLDKLKNTHQPQSATALALVFNVTRQVVVGDVALLRAAGNQILATPRGYLYEPAEPESKRYGFIGIVACKHTDTQLLDELYTVVDYGGCVIDVTIEHSIYGEISGILDIRSRYDADEFVSKVKSGVGRPLSDLTYGIHLHKIGCTGELAFQRIKDALKEKGIALS